MLALRVAFPLALSGCASLTGEGGWPANVTKTVWPSPPLSSQTSVSPRVASNVMFLATPGSGVNRTDLAATFMAAWILLVDIRHLPSTALRTAHASTG